MTKSCPNCGASNAQESRFCRRCGVPLKSMTDDATSLVSPMATTVPLIDEGRSTDGFAPDDPRRGSPDTTRVNRADLDAILRASRAPQTDDEDAGVDSIGHETVFDPSLQFKPPLDGSSLPHVDDTAETEVQFPSSPTNDGESEPGESRAAEAFAAHVSTPATGDSNAFQTTNDGDARSPGNDNAQTTDDARTTTDVPVANASLSASAHAMPPTRHAPPRAGRPRWLMPLLGVVVILFLGVAGVGGWLALRYFRRPVTSDPVNVSSVSPDAKQLFAEKLAEAESLLASGDIDGGIARLREAITLDPSDVNTHRRLADLLLQNGRPREAAEEYRAITRLDANDASAWRSLASIQFGENLHADAVESYRRFFELSGDAGQQDATALLAYADALRFSGKTDEARAIYEKVSASTTMVEEARIARQRLVELAAKPAASPTPSRDPRTDPRRTDLSRNDQPETSQMPPLDASTPAPTPPPAPTPAPTPARVELSGGEHFARGQQLWSSNRAAALSEFRAAAGKGNADAYYYLGLSVAEGRDPRSLSRAELVSALQYFQNARRSRFAGEARRYEDQLGREFDRRRN